MESEKELPIPPHTVVRAAVAQRMEELEILRRQLRVSEDHANKKAERRAKQQAAAQAGSAKSA